MHIFVRSLTLAAVLMVISVGAALAQSVDSSDSSTPASAVDKAAARKKSSASDDWNGFYAGGYGGFAMRRSTANTSTAFTSTGYLASTSVTAINSSGQQTLDSTRFNGGGTFGYNHQSGRWVIGGEADLGVQTGTTSATTTTTYPCCGATAFTITQSIKSTWLFTARPRVGRTWGKKAFAYVTGGLALTNLNYQARFTDTFAAASESGGSNTTKAGWTGGGGIETKVNDRWSIKAEYLYADFGRTTVTSNNLTATPVGVLGTGNTFTHSIFTKESLVRFGVNYHF